MAKKKLNVDDKVNKYTSEYTKWRSSLKPYWTPIKKNQELYEFYKRDYEDTESDISLNTPFSIVESMVSRINETSIDVTVDAKGENGLRDFEDWVASTIKGAIEDPDTADIYGPFRKTKEKFARDFLVKGNAVAEVSYCYKTNIVEGEKRVVADNPVVSVLPLYSVVFNPSRTLMNSDVYYVEKFVSYDYLRSKEQGKDGKGLYINLGQLKEHLDNEGRTADHSEDQYIVGDSKVPRKVESIRLLERWEGAKLTVIAEDFVIIRDEYDPLKIGRHPLLLAMNYTVENRPYAYGELDPIYKSVRAQDTIINQNLDIINRYLRPAYLVNPQSKMDLDQLTNILENGGIMYGDVNAIGAPDSSLPLPPAQAFTQIDLMQQAIERAARYSPYASGLTSQQTDKTQGTMGGITRLQAAAEPNFQVKIDAIQDMFMQPLARIYLQMIGSLMGDDEIRYGLLQGKDLEWVRVTKGILQGRATIPELVEAGIIPEDAAFDYLYTLDEFTGEVVPIEGADEAYVFDVDWIVKIRLDNQSATDKLEEIRSKMNWVDWSRNLGAQFVTEKVVTEIGRGLGVDNPESWLVSQDDMQEQQTPMAPEAMQGMAPEAMQGMAPEAMAGQMPMPDMSAMMGMQGDGY